MEVKLAVEGTLDEAVARKILAMFGLVVGPVHGKRGKHYIDDNLKGFNNAARFEPWLVIRDLNSDCECAPHLVRARLPNPASCMVFRLAVKEIESWLMADAVELARYLRMRSALIPKDTDNLAKPKEELIRLSNRSSSRKVREGMVPRPGSGASEGPLYTTLMAEFARNSWSPASAACVSESLDGCIKRVQVLARQISCL